jgi:hypothetical protein
MTKYLAVLVLVLVGCGTDLKFPSHIYTSNCGIRLYAETSVGFQAAEDRALANLPPTVDLKCPDLSGWIVQVVPYGNDAGSFYDRWGRKVGGLNYAPDFAKIQIGTSDWAKSGLAHELVHIKLYSEPDYSHIGWENGINQAIERSR